MPLTGSFCQRRGCAAIGWPNATAFCQAQTCRQAQLYRPLAGTRYLSPSKTSDVYKRQAYELLVCNSAIGNLIRENKTFRITSAIQTGAKQGMILLDDSLFSLWKEQKCAKADVLAKAQSPDELSARIANAERGLFEEEDEKGKPGKDDHK